MYDPFDDPWFPSTDPPVHPFLSSPVRPQSDLVTHLVFVGGRLAETWSEEAADSDYAEFARSLTHERRRVDPPPPPDVPAHVRLLAWLDEQAGGRESLVRMTADRLADVGTDVPEANGSLDRQRLMEVAELIDGCASVLLRLEEWGSVCRRALVVLWETDREVIRQAPTPAHVAAGIVWSIGRANGWFPRSGHSICTQSALRDHFVLTTYPSAFGKSVQTALRTVWPTGALQPWGWQRPTTPDLDPLGRPDLLTTSTRSTLLRLRDQALASEQIAASEGRRQTR